MRPRMKLIVVGSIALFAMLTICVIGFMSSGEKESKNASTGSGGSLRGGNPEVSNPDPNVGNEAYALHALAIGDWGSTTYKYGSCCNRYRQTEPNSQELYKDFWAQKNVAELLAQSAARLSPHVIISHGDNMYVYLIQIYIYVYMCVLCRRVDCSCVDTGTDLAHRTSKTDSKLHLRACMTRKLLKGSNGSV